MHRWVWDFRPDPRRGGRGRGGPEVEEAVGAAAVAAASSDRHLFSAAHCEWQTLTQPLVSKPDPRGMKW